MEKCFLVETRRTVAKAHIAPEGSGVAVVVIKWFDVRRAGTRNNKVTPPGFKRRGADGNRNRKK